MATIRNMPSEDLCVRQATAADAAACAAIYAPYVRDTAITFETDPPTAAEMAQRITKASATHAWLVLEEADEIVGYAYGSPYKERAAYRWACEVSVYLELGRRRSGGGRALYAALFHQLADARFPHGRRRHDPAEPGKRRAAPRHGILARRYLPAHRLEARRLARRGMDATPDRPRPAGPAGRTPLAGETLAGLPVSRAPRRMADWDHGRQP